MAATQARHSSSSSAAKCSNASASCSPPLHDAVADIMFRFGLFDGMDESEGSCSPNAAAKAAMKYLFELERAFWFYCDYVAAAGNFPKLSLQDFIRVVATLSPDTCEACAAALGIAARDIYSLSAALCVTFNKYKQQIPVCGAFLLNRAMTHVVLIMPWVGKSWQFPKGKTVSGETPRECALREVQEETGIDASQWMLEDSVEVQYKRSGPEASGRVRMFFAVGVPENLSMSPQVMKEVRAVQWHALADIQKTLSGNGRMQFGAVAPMFVTLKDWIRCRLDSSRVSMEQRGGRVKFAQHDVDVREYSPVEPPARVRAPGQSPVDPLRPTYVRPSILRRRNTSSDDDSSSCGSTPVPSPLESPYSSPEDEDSPSDVRAAPVWPTHSSVSAPVVASSATVEQAATPITSVASAAKADAQPVAAQVSFGELPFLRISSGIVGASKFSIPSFSFNVDAVMAGL